MVKPKVIRVKPRGGPDRVAAVIKKARAVVQEEWRQQQERMADEKRRRCPTCGHLPK